MIAEQNQSDDDIAAKRKRANIKVVAVLGFIALGIYIGFIFKHL